MQAGKPGGPVANAASAGRYELWMLIDTHTRAILATMLVPSSGERLPSPSPGSLESQPEPEYPRCWVDCSIIDVVFMPDERGDHQAQSRAHTRVPETTRRSGQPRTRTSERPERIERGEIA